jgi:hypothetical protein
MRQSALVRRSTALISHLQDVIMLMALFCWSCFGLFQLVSDYSLSQNTIESAKTSRLFHQPNQPYIYTTS